jgi:hypothetical protein
MFPTLKKIRQRTRFFIDEPVQANFTDADLNYAINEAQQFVATEISQVDEQYFVNTTPTVITLQQGVQYYNLASDFWKMTRMEDVQTGLPISFTDINGQNQNVATVVPPLVSANSAGFSAMIVGNSLGFSPAPTQNGLQARYWYVPVLKDLASDQATSQIPRMFVDLIAIQAAIDAMIKDENDTSALERLYNRKFSQLTRVARDRQQQNPKKVHRVNDTMGVPGLLM